MVKKRKPKKARKERKPVGKICDGSVHDEAAVKKAILARPSSGPDANALRPW